MDHAAYCAERARRAPGDWPLIALFAPAAAKPGLAALAALLAELDDALRAAHAADLALPRLEWWRAELAGLARGAPHHPVSRALALAHAFTPGDAALLEELVDGALDTLDGVRTGDADAWALWRYRTGGAPLALAARLSGCALEERQVFALGGALAELQALGRLGRRARRGWLSLGPDAPAEVAPRAPSPAMLGHVATRLTALAAELRSHGQALAAAAPRATPLWVAMALGEQRHARLAADPVRAWTGAAEAGAVRRVWRAWRAAVAHRQP